MSFVYDGAGVSNSKGRLTEVSNAYSTSKITAYDAFGRITGSSQTTGGITYPFGYTYNLDGTLATQTYGDTGRIIGYQYDTAGRLLAAGLGDPQTQQFSADYATNVKYRPHGAIEELTLGNGLKETTTYNNRLQPCTVSAGTLMTLQFRYGAAHDPADCNVTTHDNNGNVYSQTVTRGAFNAAQTYTYDGVNRLDMVTEAGVGAWSRDYVYDPYGNMKLATSGFTFDSATNRLTDSGYDQAGNMTSFLGGTMTYDANNKMTSFTGTGMPVKSGEYLYDGQGQRVQRMSTEGSTTTTTTYVYDAFGKLAAEYSSRAPTGTGGTFFRTTDHLGSTRLVTDAAQNACEERDFYPFGEKIDSGVGGRSYAGGCGFSQQFTAKERDDESDLDYFLARYYASSLGRFNSVDPMNAGATPALPQSWNAYSYVLNGPLSLIDPTGEVWVSLGGDYSWVDGDCPSGDAQCVTSLASVEQNGNVNVYAQDGSRHTLTPNENGVVSVVDLAAIPGSGIEVGPQNVVENYLSPQTAAQFFNLSGDYQLAFQGDGPLVFTGGSAETGNPGVNPQTGRPVHSTHYRGENVDLRYMGPNGQNIRSATAADSADVARTRFIVGGVHQAITSDPGRFGSIPASPATLRAHRNHIHLIPFPGAGRRTR